MTEKMTKKDARELLLKKRNSLTKEEVQSASESIIKDIDAILKESKDAVVLGFMPLGNEIDLRALYEKILAGYYKENFDIDIILGLPRVCGKEMRFFNIDSLDNLEKSKFGIMEPRLNSEEIIAKNAHVMVPIIGLDKDKRRLGFGGGFYDKYFGKHKDNKLYGLVYDFQMNIDFEVNEYDIAMDHIFMAKVG